MADDFPSSTLDPYGFITFTIPAAAPTETWHLRAKETMSPTPTLGYDNSPSPTSITPDASASAESQAIWDKVTHGAKIAIIMAAILGLFLVIFFSAWFCCNCCGLRRKKRRTAARAEGNGELPLHTIQNRGVDEAATTGRPISDAPPTYEEAVPAQHQRLAGGISNTITTSEEDDAVVSDGKTPLSEIPFEDVVLDHDASSQSSGSRMFDQMHHGAGGDTRGHTNS